MPESELKTAFNPYASQRGMYIGRIDMARGLIRHLENEIAQIEAKLDRWPIIEEVPLSTISLAATIMNTFAPEGKSDGWWYATLPKLETYLKEVLQVERNAVLGEACTAVGESSGAAILIRLLRKP